LIVDLNFRIYVDLRFRVLGIDTPERGKPGWAEATAFGNTFAPVGSKVAIRSHKSDSFGRWLAEVEVDGISYAGQLLEYELAVPYFR
jgi:micrococcal nuclease